MAAVSNKNIERSVGSLKGELSIDTTFDPPLISLDSAMSVEIAEHTGELISESPSWRLPDSS
jgi:hypothetical protein